MYQGRFLTLYCRYLLANTVVVADAKGPVKVIDDLSVSAPVVILVVSDAVRIGRAVVGLGVGNVFHIDRTDERYRWRAAVAAVILVHGVKAF